MINWIKKILGITAIEIKQKEFDKSLALLEYRIEKVYKYFQEQKNINL